MVLYCDVCAFRAEGLDSTTAFHLCLKLRELADQGRCTIVCTIHQPSSKTFKLFSNLILLASGGWPNTDVLIHRFYIGC
jgi:hypothetical protein